LLYATHWRSDLRIQIGIFSFFSFEKYKINLRIEKLLSLSRAFSLISLFIILSSRFYIIATLQSIEYSLKNSQARWSRDTFYHNLSLLFSVIVARRFRTVEKIMSLLLGRRNFHGSNRPRHLAHFTEVSADSITTGNTEKDVTCWIIIIKKNEWNRGVLIIRNICKILFLNIQVIFIAIWWTVEFIIINIKICFILIYFLQT